MSSMFSFTLEEENDKMCMVVYVRKYVNRRVNKWVGRFLCIGFIGMRKM